MGLLHAVAEPFTAEDSARVELIPLEGEVLQFVVKDGAVEAVRAKGAVFARC